MRSSAEVLAELLAFNESFRVGWPPAGTPFRKQLWRETCIIAQARACLPDNVKRRLSLLAELKAARRSESARLAAVRRASDPVQQERARIFRVLRGLGFAREHTSGRSAYYRRGGFVVRVSDHEVPDTPEREYNRESGGRSWVGSRWSFVVGGSLGADEWLADVREACESE